MARNYQELIAWQRGMDLVVQVYQVTQKFPSSELYGLTNQLRRAAVSIPSNIAEGQGRGSIVEFKRFLRIANGSRQEVETQLLVARRLGYLNENHAASCMEIAEETGRLIRGLVRSLPEDFPVHTDQE